MTANPRRERRADAAHLECPTCAGAGEVCDGVLGADGDPCHHPPITGRDAWGEAFCAFCAPRWANGRLPGG